MPTLVKISKWGNSLGLRLPKPFADQRDLVDGSLVEIDSLKVVNDRPRHRSRYKLKEVIKGYSKPPKTTDLPRVGKELA